MIDIHNHLFINVDDGPGAKSEVLDLLNQAIDQGITNIICTPHHYSGSYVTPSNVVNNKLDEVRNIIKNNDLDIEAHPGQEIRMNDYMLPELETGESIALNNTQYVLVEFSFTSLRNDVHEMLGELIARGYTPVIAHPERCRPIVRDVNQLRQMVDNGAKAQVTAASVAGELGTQLQELSLKWIEEGLIHIVASDAHHAVYRPFLMKEALQVIDERLGGKVRDELVKNAESVLYDKKI